MSLTDKFTTGQANRTHDTPDQNDDRVLNHETRRALGRELQAAKRLWAVILAFVPFVYVSVFLWSLGLSIQLLVVALAADMLAGIAVSMYVAIRVNLILRPRGESQSLADTEESSAEAEVEDEAADAEADEDVASRPDESERAAETEQQETDAPEPSDPEDDPATDTDDSEPTDEQAETQSTHDTADTSSERLI